MLSSTRAGASCVPNLDENLASLSAHEILMIQMNESRWNGVFSLLPQLPAGVYIYLGWGRMSISFWEYVLSLAIRPQCPIIFSKWHETGAPWTFSSATPQSYGATTELLEELGSSRWSQKHLTGLLLSTTAHQDGVSFSKPPPLNVVATISSRDSSGLIRFYSLIWRHHDGRCVNLCHITVTDWGVLRRIILLS